MYIRREITGYAGFGFGTFAISAGLYLLLLRVDIGYGITTLGAGAAMAVGSALMLERLEHPKS